MSKLKLENYADNIIAEYSSGVTISELSNKYNCYNQNITNLLKRYKVYTPLNKSGSINSNYFSNIDTNIKAYFVGFIFGDGALVKATRSSTITLTITLNEKDECVLNKLREELNMSRPLTRITRKEGFKHVRLVTSDKQIVSDLRKLGMDFRKSLTMGNVLQNIPGEFRNSFILGLFDADGSCTVRDAEYWDKRDLKNRTSLKQMVQFRLTLPMCNAVVSHLDIKTYHISTSESIPNLVISAKSEFIKFFRKVYSNCNFYLQRKYEKFIPIVNQDQTISSSSNSEELGARVEIIA